ncbi:MAG: hypothetical protein JSV41_10020 [Gemmatimonadota bacterium]|nr:MAG: hypothetical protein JSV41_10020 [Gemmatimonadota bacterium]
MRRVLAAGLLLLTGFVLKVAPLTASPASFDLKGLSGFSVQFTRDEVGVVTELVLYQPNGTFVAKRR